MHPLLNAFFRAVFGLSDLGAPLRYVGVRLPHYCWAAAALQCPRHVEMEAEVKLCLGYFRNTRTEEGVFQSRFSVHPSFCSSIMNRCLGYEMEFCQTKTEADGEYF